jgi:hypothetical protein
VTVADLIESLQKFPPGAEASCYGDRVVILTGDGVDRRVIGAIDTNSGEVEVIG